MPQGLGTQCKGPTELLVNDAALPSNRMGVPKHLSSLQKVWKLRVNSTFTISSSLCESDFGCGFGWTWQRTLVWKSVLEVLVLIFLMWTHRSTPSASNVCEVGNEDVAEMGPRYVG